MIQMFHFQFDIIYIQTWKATFKIKRQATSKQNSALTLCCESALLIVRLDLETILTIVTNLISMPFAERLAVWIVSRDRFMALENRITAGLVQCVASFQTNFQITILQNVKWYNFWSDSIQYWCTSFPVEIRQSCGKRLCLHRFCRLSSRPILTKQLPFYAVFTDLFCVFTDLFCVQSKTQHDGIIIIIIIIINF